MFKSLKKTKLQEIENKKMNDNFEENVEKNEDISVNSTSVFPSAKDTLENSAKKWKQVTSKEILEEITTQTSGGKRYAEFFNSIISEELVKELENQGYKVEIQAEHRLLGPYFRITW